MTTLEGCRRFYAEEIRVAANIHSAALVEAFARVPREKYLGPPPWQLDSAEQRALSFVGLRSSSYTTTEDPQDVYHNVMVALDAAHDINNGQPSALARWIEALDLKAGERVYHLGCGVGYYTAIIAEVVGPGGCVEGSEVNAELAARAHQNLAAYPNVTVHFGDGAAHDPGVCDAMLINAGVTHPQRTWLERLREGGRLVLPLTIAASVTLGQGPMVRITRQRGAFAAEIVTFVGIFSCTSGRDPELEPRLAQAMGNRSFFKLKSVRLEAHEPTDTCIVHGSSVCLSTAEPLASPAASRETA
jgi:protein-L-isoaspartate(D-aspartate) O-methyltransferase